MANRSIRTKKNRERFLAALDQGKGNVSTASAGAKISRRAAYEWRKDDEDFRGEWDDIVEKHMDALEEVVYSRALDGWDEPVFYQGEEVGSIRKFSDSNAQFILRNRRAHVYGDKSKIEVGGIGGGSLVIEVEFVEEKLPPGSNQT